MVTISICLKSNPTSSVWLWSSTVAWKIPWMEEPGGLQSMGSQRVGHDWATSLSLSCIGEGNGNPLQYSCLENPRDGGAWRAAVYGVAQSRTRLKRLSSSSNEYQWELSNFTLRTGRPDLCGGPGVKNPPANQCRRYRFIPGPGRFHMPRSNKAQASQLLSQRALKFVLWGARALPLERSPHWPQLERVLLQQRRPSEAKNVNKWIKLKKKKRNKKTRELPVSCQGTENTGVEILCPELVQRRFNAGGPHWKPVACRV